MLVSREKCDKIRYSFALIVKRNPVQSHDKRATESSCILYITRDLLRCHGDQCSFIQTIKA